MRFLLPVISKEVEIIKNEKGYMQPLLQSLESLVTKQCVTCFQPSHGSCDPNIRYLVLAASNCDLVEERLASSPALELVISATEVLRPWISVCLELSSSSKH